MFRLAFLSNASLPAQWERLRLRPALKTYRIPLGPAAVGTSQWTPASRPWWGPAQTPPWSRAHAGGWTARAHPPRGPSAQDGAGSLGCQSAKPLCQSLGTNKGTQVTLTLHKPPVTSAHSPSRRLRLIQIFQDWPLINKKCGTIQMADGNNYEILHQTIAMQWRGKFRLYDISAAIAVYIYIDIALFLYEI